MEIISLSTQNFKLLHVTGKQLSFIPDLIFNNFGPLESIPAAFVTSILVKERTNSLQE